MMSRWSFAWPRTSTGDPTSPSLCCSGSLPDGRVGPRRPCSTPLGGLGRAVGVGCGGEDWAAGVGIGPLQHPGQRGSVPPLLAPRVQPPFDAERGWREAEGGPGSLQCGPLGRPLPRQPSGGGQARADGPGTPSQFAAATAARRGDGTGGSLGQAGSGSRHPGPPRSWSQLN